MGKETALIGHIARFRIASFDKWHLRLVNLLVFWAGHVCAGLMQFEKWWQMNQLSDTSLCLRGMNLASSNKTGPIVVDIFGVMYWSQIVFCFS